MRQKKFKKFTTMILAFTLILTLLPHTSAQAAGAWDGISRDTSWYVGRESDSTYNIDTAEKLAGLARLVTVDGKSFAGKTINLTADIDLGGQLWSPIGHSVAKVSAAPFAGYFIGNYNVISNLKIDNATLYYQGLFGFCDGANISQVILKDPDINARGAVGAIVGAMQNSTVNQCAVIGGSVKGETDVGGIAGSNLSLTAASGITNCYSSCSVAATGETGTAGGIAGSNTVDGARYAYVSKCYSTGAISASGKNSIVGGVVGVSDKSNNGTEEPFISACFAINASISATGEGSRVGIISADSTGTASKNFASGMIIAQPTSGTNELNGTPLTKTQLQTQSTYTDAGIIWDFGSIWEMGLVDPMLPVFKGSNAPTIDDVFINPFDSGEGSAADPFVIKTEDQLRLVATSPMHWCYKLDDDLTLTGGAWTPIGSKDHPYTGTFDGGQHFIKDVSVSSTADYQGFFGNVWSGTVKNLELRNPVVSGGNYTGALAGCKRGGLFEQCAVIGGTVTGGEIVGGLVGLNSARTSFPDATIKNCYTTCAVKSDYPGAMVGGIAGENLSDGNETATIRQCYATGAVSGKVAMVGGIVGHNNDPVSINNYKVKVNSCYAANTSVISDYGESGTIYVGRVIGYSVDGSQHPDLFAHDEMDSTYVGTVGCVNGVKASLAAMQTDTTYKFPANGSAWDFNNTWRMAADGAKMPIFQWQTTGGPDQFTKTFSNGNGSATEPYVITTEAGLRSIGSLAMTNCYRLGADIVLTDRDGVIDWIPIGGNIAAYTGTFDGDGHTISGLYINAPTVDYQGMFGFTNGAVIKDVGLIAPNITGKANVGGIAGRALYSIISGCAVYGGSVSGTSNVGGITGYLAANVQNTAPAHAEISNCFASSEIISEASSGNTYAGGIAGYISTSSNSNWPAIDVLITNCYSTGSITATTTDLSKDAFAGGISGGAQSSTSSGLYPERLITISDCFNSSSIKCVATSKGYVSGGVPYCITLNNGKIIYTNCVDLNPALTAEAPTKYIGRALAFTQGGGLTSSGHYALETMAITGGTPSDTATRDVSAATAPTKGFYDGIGWDFTSATPAWAIREGQAYPYLASNKFVQQLSITLVDTTVQGGTETATLNCFPSPAVPLKHISWTNAAGFLTPASVDTANTGTVTVTARVFNLSAQADMTINSPLSAFGPTIAWTGSGVDPQHAKTGSVPVPSRTTQLSDSDVTVAGVAEYFSDSRFANPVVLPIVLNTGDNTIYIKVTSGGSIVYYALTINRAAPAVVISDSTEAATINAHGEKIPYTIDSGGLATLMPTDVQMKKLFSTGADAVIFDLSEVSGVNGAVIFLLSDWFDSTGDRLTLKFGSYSFTINDWDCPDIDDGTKVRASLTKSSVNVSLSQNATELYWYNFERPIVLSMPATSASVMIDKATGKVVPRSWYADGKVYAKVYATGIYDAKSVTAQSFTDTKGLWMDAATVYMAERGVVNGVGDNLFAPGRSVTRGEFITMLMRAVNIEPQGAWMVQQFSDAKEGAFYYDALLKAKALGLVSGVGDNKFNPDAQITRQDMFVMLYNAMVKCIMIAPSEGGMALQEYSDNGEIASYANEALLTFVQDGIISGKGDGRLDPRGTATRAEAAQVIYNVLMRDTK